MWKFFATLIIFYFIFKVINRVLISLFLKPKSQGTSSNSSYHQKKTGEVTINFGEQKEKIVDKKEGEYIDFEEIK